MTRFEKTPLEGPIVVTPARYGDARGYFSETWSRRTFEAEGLIFDWCQDNHSYSRNAGVLRGLHCQAPPMAQAKLVRCTAGRIWDVAVDIRGRSPGFGKWFGIELSAENGRQLMIPRGFLHGFVTLTPDVEVSYKVDNAYAGDLDQSIAWDDPDLGIGWPLAEIEGGLTDGRPVLSAKDATAVRLSEWINPFAEWDGSA